MKSNKAQAAMEFLMTYGWAILVVLVAIGALAYFGVLSPEKLLPEKCIVATGSGLFCDKNLVTADAAGDKITMRLKNINTDPIVIKSIVVGTTCTDAAVDTPIAAEGTADVVITCANLAAGKLKADLTIQYTLLAAEGGNFSKTVSGSLVTTAG